MRSYTYTRDVLQQFIVIMNALSLTSAVVIRVKFIMEETRKDSYKSIYHHENQQAHFTSEIPSQILPPVWKYQLHFPYHHLRPSS
jgi:hypothetical protein